MKNQGNRGNRGDHSNKNGGNGNGKRMNALISGFAALTLCVLAPTNQAHAETPSFYRWYFTTCDDTKTYDTRTGILAGRPYQCELVIETHLYNVSLVSAVFTYELEYNERGVTKKIKLKTPDKWPSKTSDVFFSQGEGKLSFMLPINVRSRKDRKYHNINVIGTFKFNDGSKKRIIEPLPIKHR